jgi:hypothetical protein
MRESFFAGLRRAARPPVMKAHADARLSSATSRAGRPVTARGERPCRLPGATQGTARRQRRRRPLASEPLRPPPSGRPARRWGMRPAAAKARSRREGRRATRPWRDAMTRAEYPRITRSLQSKTHDLRRFKLSGRPRSYPPQGLQEPPRRAPARCIRFLAAAIQPRSPPARRRPWAPRLPLRGHLVTASVRIGRGVTVGLMAEILPGCTIGDGAVIAAGAVLSKGERVGPGEVWAGVPARRVGRRREKTSRVSGSDEVQTSTWPSPRSTPARC